jgi:hypothetical protein
MYQLASLPTVSHWGDKTLSGLDGFVLCGVANDMDGGIFLKSLYISSLLDSLFNYVMVCDEWK